MAAKVGPMRTPQAGPKRAESLRSIVYHDKAREVQNVGGAPMELDPEQKWITDRIKCRVCKQFISAEPPANITSIPGENRSCMCGGMFDEHTEDATRSIAKSYAPKWKYEQQTQQMTTNAFGEVKFVDFGGNVAKYIRVDVDTEVKHMLDVMVKVWGMEKPNILISVTGGAKNFTMGKRLKETFRRGLMKTALTTGAWIITGGTHAGVMKHVGEAVRDFGVASSSKGQVVTIGIAPWGCIQNRHVLENDKNSDCRPASYRFEKELQPKQAFLDPNHSHFILCDNGTHRKFAIEIPFRAKLETEIAKMHTDTGKNAVSVPIVLLVLEGGPGTLETVENAIKENTPAVVVKGSGRAADILAFAYQNSKEDESKPGTLRCMKQKELKQKVTEMVEKEFKNTANTDTKIDTHMNQIEKCLEKGDLMSVFELDSTSGTKEIDVAMLQALLKANKNEVMDQLRLALAWNRIDVAKSDIFTDDNRWTTGSLDDVMLLAIQQNRVDFVELFLDHGVSLPEFLTKKRLLKLYKELPGNCLLRAILTKTKDRIDPERNDFSLRDVGVLMQDLLGDYYRVSDVAEKCLHGTITNESRAKATSQENGSQQQYDFENPPQELFIWSVMMIRQEMAKLFWAEGKDAIAAALVSYGLLRAMQRETDDTELVNKMQDAAIEWSNLAVGVLNDLHSMDEHKAQCLLVRELSNWGDSTCMLIAVNADNKEFIAQTPCQSLLNSIWMGKMMRDNSTIMLLLCSLCPLMVPFLLNFHTYSEKTAAAAKFSSASIRSETPTEDKKTPVLQRTSNMSTYVRGSRTSINSPNAEENSFFVYSAGKKLYHFFTAPVIIFIYNVISYLIFLLLFSYVLIVDFNFYVSKTEVVLIIWVVSMVIEEVRQVMFSASSTLASKLKNYIFDSWNVVDLTAVLLFIIALVLRSINNNMTHEASRVFLALNFVTFAVRLLHIFSVRKELGPKVVMIGRMIQDLMYFVLILMVFVVAYAVASYAILFPNAELSWDTVIAVIRRPYWNIYGELLLEDLEGDNGCSSDPDMWGDGSTPRCPTTVGKYVVPIMMGMYMMLANVLLLNLLIAMFSYTFQKVQDNTDKHWTYMRYSLIYEYYTRPVLCPPFIILAHIYLAIKFVAGCYRCRDGKNSTGNAFRRTFRNERELVQWENVIADAFHHTTKMKATDSVDYKVNTTHKRLDTLMNLVEELQERQQQIATNHPAREDEQQQTTKDVVLLKGRQNIDAMMANNVQIHHSSRQTPYLGTNQPRFPIPDTQVMWSVPFANYNPPMYTSTHVLKNPKLADPDLMQMSPAERMETITDFNNVDPSYNCNRRSFLGIYSVQEGLPLNIMGRTGLLGRGELRRFGPNHAGDIVVTRWKMRDSHRVMKHKKPVLKVAAVMMSDNHMWALPEAILTPGVQPIDHLHAKLSDEFIAAKTSGAKSKKKELKQMWKNGVLIYEGYADDPRNTDNAWLESTVLSYHDDNDTIFSHFNLKAGKTGESITWITASSKLTFHGPHLFFLKKTAEKLGAHF